MGRRSIDDIDEWHEVNGVPREGDLAHVWTAINKLHTFIFEGNGQEALIVRMKAVETIAAAYSEIAPKMETFLAVQEDREKRSSSRMAKVGAIIGLVALFAPEIDKLLEMFVKHLFGG